MLMLSNPSSVKTRLNDEDLHLLDLYVNGNSFATFITESAFYDVLLFSSSKKVKPYRRWVTHEILPSIRKYGAYMTSDLIGGLARIISQNGFHVGQDRLFGWLRNNHCSGSVGERRNMPDQQYVGQGLFELRKGFEILEETKFDLLHEYLHLLDGCKLK